MNFRCIIIFEVPTQELANNSISTVPDYVTRIGMSIKSFSNFPTFQLKSENLISWVFWCTDRLISAGRLLSFARLSSRWRVEPYNGYTRREVIPSCSPAFMYLYICMCILTKILACVRVNVCTFSLYFLATRWIYYYQTQKTNENLIGASALLCIWIDTNGIGHGSKHLVCTFSSLTGDECTPPLLALSITYLVQGQHFSNLLKLTPKTYHHWPIVTTDNSLVVCVTTSTR